MGKKSASGVVSSPSKIGSFFKSIPSVAKDLAAHWNKPYDGKFLTNKEFAAYCLGGMGVMGAVILPSFVQVAAGIYIAVALNIKVIDIAIIGIIINIVGIVRAPFVGMLMDNTRTKMGKFRPYLLWMPIPTFICFILVAWVPPLFSTYMGMVISYTVFICLLQTFMSIYGAAFTNLVQVISPSVSERTNLMSIGAFVYSLGPSIINALFPVFAQIIYGNDGLNNINTFKWIIPAFALVFLGLGFFAAIFTKERTVVSKQYKQKVSFVSGIKQISKNKYFWLATSSNLLGLMKVTASGFAAWICIYMLNNSAALGGINLLFGTASVPGMLLAPLLIKKFGKKWLIIASNLITCVAMIPMMIFNGVAVVMLLCSYLILLANGVQVVTGPSITSQQLDYQQFKTGDRVEGFLSNFSGILTSAATIGTSLIAPAVYVYFGFVRDSNVLYSPAIRNPIFFVLILISFVSAILCCVPMLFWDMTEKKHDRIMEILRIRADKEDGVIDEDTAATLEKQVWEGKIEVSLKSATDVEITETSGAAEASEDTGEMI